MVTTYNKILEFRAGAQFYEKAEKEKAEKEKRGRERDSKLAYAIRKVFKKTSSIIEKHEEALQDLRVEHAATDDDGIFLENERGTYRFTKEGTKAFNEAERKLRKAEVNIAGLAHYASEIPKDLDPDFVDIFVGFVIDPEWVNEDGELIRFSLEEKKGKKEMEPEKDVSISIKGNGNLVNV
ncbi:MAG: hypothetical protein E6R03_10940 [Hyphomicrobiaceae bacterium]|nr:MAG: hypothetical protein E6R03_10940 [Hyphomicrobiaceae bacterium]